jgi:hypothetical protein
MIFVPDIPEFAPLVYGAQRAGDYRVHAPLKGYWRIEANQEISFNRKELGLGPALWNSALTGGFNGQIIEYGRDILRIGNPT